MDQKGRKRPASGTGNGTGALAAQKWIAEGLRGQLSIVVGALCAFEEENDNPAIRTIRERAALALKRHTEAGYNAWVAQELAANHRIDESHATPAGELSERARREQRRQHLFTLCTPKMILGPANIVAMYLHEHPMWNSWDWPETEAVNTRM